MTIFFYIGACLTGLISLHIATVPVALLQVIANYINSEILTFILYALSYGIGLMALIAIIMAHIALWWNFKNMAAFTVTPPTKALKEIYDGIAWMLKQIVQALSKCLTLRWATNLNKTK